MNTLSIIADNPTLRADLETLLAEEVQRLPEGAEGFSDERLGQIARARIDGLAALKRAFRRIDSFKTFQAHDHQHIPR